jgi:hypothetical protein
MGGQRKHLRRLAATKRRELIPEMKKKVHVQDWIKAAAAMKAAHKKHLEEGNGDNEPEKEDESDTRDTGENCDSTGKNIVDS